jgi:hypothetical protein
VTFTEYHAWLRRQPCLRCWEIPAEAAHLRCVASWRTPGDYLPRRKGPAIWAAIPLCASCHRTAKDSLHAVGERAFFADMNMPDGWAAALCLRYLAERLEEGK